MKKILLFLLVLMFQALLFAVECFNCHKDIPENADCFKTSDGHTFCSEHCVRTYIDSKAKKCYVCGSPMMKGFQNGDKYFCSEKCLEKWREKSYRQCCVCGKKAGQGFENGDKFFCSEACVAKWKEQFYKTCVICGKKTEQYWTSAGKFYCSEECYRKSLPRCMICRKSMTGGGIITSDGRHICAECENLPKCVVCNLPTKRRRTQPDGRLLCDDCVKHGIFDEDAAYRQFTDVRYSLEDMFDLKIDGNVHFHLCGKDKMADLTGNTKPQELGLCTFSEETETERGSGRVLKRVVRRDIYILYGLPKELFRSVAAHELAHDWFNRNVQLNAPLKVGEGWAQYVAWCYCKEKKYKGEMEKIEKNDLPNYGDGFKMISAMLNISDGPKKLARQLKDLCK